MVRIPLLVALSAVLAAAALAGCCCKESNITCPGPITGEQQARLYPIPWDGLDALNEQGKAQQMEYAYTLRRAMACDGTAMKVLMEFVPADAAAQRLHGQCMLQVLRRAGDSCFACNLRHEADPAQDQTLEALRAALASGGQPDQNPVATDECFLKTYPCTYEQLLRKNYRYTATCALAPTACCRTSSPCGGPTCPDYRNNAQRLQCGSCEK
jgi:hypothetical protein